jgi:hypothetical protein
LVTPPPWYPIPNGECSVGAPSTPRNLVSSDADASTDSDSARAPLCCECPPGDGGGLPCPNIALARGDRGGPGGDPDNDSPFPPPVQSVRALHSPSRESVREDPRPPPPEPPRPRPLTASCNRETLSSRCVRLPLPLAPDPACIILCPPLGPPYPPNGDDGRRNSAGCGGKLARDAAFRNLS